MKTSLPTRAADAPSLQTARGFIASNLALPGLGSLLARRKVGWFQLALTVAGFALTMLFGVRLVIWFFKNMDAAYGPNSDPVETMLAIWQPLRWALAGIGCFLVSLTWAMSTNAAILRSARVKDESDKPPILR